MRPVQPQKDGPLSNEDIASPEVQLIDAEGVNQGAIKTRDALAQAQELGLDLVIIAAYGWMTAEEAETVAPRVVFVDERNRITERRTQERTPLCVDAFAD